MGERTFTRGQDIAWAEAHKVLGRRFWLWYVLWRHVVRAAFVLGVPMAAMYALWSMVPHWALATCALTAGCALLGAALWRRMSVAGLRTRLMTGGRTSGPVVVLALSGTVLVAAGVAILRYGM